MLMPLTAISSLESSSGAEIVLRPSVPPDEPFFLSLYSAIRASELDAWHWPEAEREKFLRFQFHAREAGLRAAAPEQDCVVVLDDRPIGRFVTGDREGALHLFEIELLPEFQGAGIGAMILRQLQERAADEGRKLTCHASRGSRAVRFYARLGFREWGGDAMYQAIEWEPGR